MPNEPILMEYTGDSPALQRTESMPSGNRYEYSGMQQYRIIPVDPQDVKAMEKLDFKKFEPAKAEVQRLAEADKETEQARETEAQQQAAVESADEPKQRRGK